MEDPVKTPINPADQIAPISVSPQKEGEPITVISNKEIILHPEVEAAGVEVIHESPKLDEVHRQLGVSLPGPSTPVVAESTAKIEFPLTSTEALASEKGSEKDSRTWLGVLLTKLYKRIGNLSLKKVTV